MFRSKRHIKLSPLNSMPGIEDLQQAMSQAQRTRGCTIELPWQLKDVSLCLALTVHVDFTSAEPIWTLYEGAGSQSHVVWSAPFTDVDLLKDVISLTIKDNLNVSADSAGISGERQFPAQETMSERGTDDSSSGSAFESNAQDDQLSQDQLDNAPFSQADQTAPGVSAQRGIDQVYPGQAPVYPQMPAPPAYPYTYFYPGYPYPYSYPQTPGQAQPQAATVPLQPAAGWSNPAETLAKQTATDPNLSRKQTSFLLGQFFVDSGLMTQAHLSIALKLQEMAGAGVINYQQAIEAIKRVHNKEGALNIAGLIRENASANTGAKKPPAEPINLRLGEILVKAGIIDAQSLQGVLKFQEIVRSGAMTQKEACQILSKELKKNRLPKARPSTDQLTREQRIVEFLFQSGLISEEDKKIVYGVHKKHGGRIDNILAAAGKVNEKTWIVASECERLLAANKIELAQAIIALNYCERSRVSLSEAIDELGWREDLDL